jgi:hypothetical protein
VGHKGYNIRLRSRNIVVGDIGDNGEDQTPGLVFGPSAGYHSRWYINE